MATNEMKFRGNPITTEIMRNAFISAAKEMNECLYRSSYSPIIYESKDCAAGLFDENAACHFALGKGFPECIENGLTMTPEQLEQKGMNDSATHVDFMFGTGDLCVTGFDKKGNAVPVFRDGGWAE